MKSFDLDLARRLSDLRRAANMSLDELSEITAVSRATLSRIERGDTSPSAAILGKLARAYEISMGDLFGVLDKPNENLFRSSEQIVWEDRETGFIRRSLTPAGSGYKGTMIEGVLPAGETISYAASPLPDLEHHLVLLKGKLRVIVGTEIQDLEAGDALRFRLNSSNSYETLGDESARYILTVIGS